MKKSDIDYKNYDKLDIYAKKERVESITKCYESFSWKLHSQKQNQKYADTVELTFVRPHKIPNKDDLLYNQIEMENTLNDLGKLKRNKHARSTALGLFMGIMSAILCILGVRLFIKSSGAIWLCLAGVITGIGICLAIITAIVSRNIYKNEELRYERKVVELGEKLETLCKEAKKLGGGNYANKD